MFHFAFSSAVPAVMLAVSASAAHAQTEVSAVLAGHAALASGSSVAAPLEAGPLFATTGKFTAANRLRADALGTGGQGFQRPGPLPQRPLAELSGRQQL